tara:strand:- start:65 stop:484 length:420 start_codon:yes stop_codon:yes gene_type:complete
MIARELRVGNFIIDKAFPELNNPKYNCIVERVGDGWIAGCNDDEGEPEDCFDPIPLTEEWLLSFGFEQMSSWGDIDGWWVSLSIQETINKFGISFHRETNFMEFYYDHGGLGQQEIEIKYVHTLQNIYFALTSKELTIK